MFELQVIGSVGVRSAYRQWGTGAGIDCSDAGSDRMQYIFQRQNWHQEGWPRKGRLVSSWAQGILKV